MTKQIVTDSISLTSLILYGGRYYSDPDNVPDLPFTPLAAGHYQPSIHTFDCWGPRPTAEMSAYSFYRRAPTGYTRRIRLRIVGGVPPWYVVINSAPPGTTINNDYEDPDYLVLTIPNVTVASGTISLTVYSQGSIDPLGLSWAFEGIDRDNLTYFLHLTAGAGGTATGTFANPMRNLGQILGPDEDDASHIGRQIIVDGEHIVSGQAAEYNLNGSRLIMNTNKPMVYVAPTVGAGGFVGSTLNDSGAEFHFESGADAMFAGLTWRNPRCNQGSGNFRNCFVHWASSVARRGGSQDCTWDLDTTEGSEGSNSCGIFYATIAAPIDYCGHAGDTFENAVNVGQLTGYTLSKWYFAMNLLTESNNGVGVYLKGGHELNDTAWYFNRCLNSTGVFATIQAIEPNAPWNRLRHEFMHNTVKAGTGIKLIGVDNDSTFSVYSRRNNYKVDNHFLQDVKAGDIFSTNYDVIEYASGTAGISLTSSGITPDTTNTTSATSGILDDTTALQAAPDGLRGAEIL